MRSLILMTLLSGCIGENKWCSTPGPYKVGQQVVLGYASSVYQGCHGHIESPTDSYIPEKQECKARYVVRITECNGTKMSLELRVDWDRLGIVGDLK